MSLKTLNALSLVGALLLTCGAALTAQNEPLLGTFELNVAKSHVTRGAPPDSGSIVNEAEPGGFRSTRTNTTSGRSGVEIHHYNFDGQFHKTEGGDPRELAFKRIDQHTIEVTTRRNGKDITSSSRVELSKDGKTLTVTSSGTSGSGQSFAGDIRVYERK